MSLTAAAIRLMALKGMTAEDIADIAEAMAPDAAPLSKGALRTRKWREKQAETSRSDVTVTQHGDVSPSCTQVVDPSLPSLRSEELKTPISPDGEMCPKHQIAKSNDFATFWKAYPKKAGKGAGEAAYAKALKQAAGPDPPATILAGVERAKASRDWLNGYIPHPAKWLKERRWEDEPAEIIPITGRPHDRPHPNSPDAKRAAREANDARADLGAYVAAGQRFQP